jgi:hypothetical protein
LERKTITGLDGVFYQSMAPLTRLDKMNERRYKLTQCFARCFFNSDEGKSTPLDLDREGDPLAGRFPRGGEGKTIPELVTKPLERIRDRGAPLTALSSVVGLPAEWEWNRESPRLLTGGLFAFSGGMNDDWDP